MHDTDIILKTGQQLNPLTSPPPPHIQQKPTLSETLPPKYKKDTPEPLPSA